MPPVACSTEYFPLTLTLSLREREQQASDWCFADGRWQTFPFAFQKIYGRHGFIPSGSAVSANHAFISYIPREYGLPEKIV